MPTPDEIDRDADAKHDAEVKGNEEEEAEAARRLGIDRPEATEMPPHSKVGGDE